MITTFINENYMAMLFVLWVLFVISVGTHQFRTEINRRNAKIIDILLELRSIGRYTERMSTADAVDYGYADGAQDLIKELDELLIDETRYGKDVVTAISILRELVACKDLKEMAEALPPCAYDDIARMFTEYERRKDAAWLMARDYLKENEA